MSTPSATDERAGVPVLDGSGTRGASVVAAGVEGAGCDDGSALLARDEVRVVAPALVGWRALLRAPVAGATWRGVSLLVVGALWLPTVGLVLSTVTVSALPLIPIAGIGLALLVFGALLLARYVARAEAWRLTAQAHVVVRAAPPRRPAAPGFWRWCVAVLLDPHGWTTTAYAALSMVLVPALTAVVLAGAVLGLAAALLPVYAPRSEVLAQYPAWLVVPVGVAGMWFVAVLAQVAALGQVTLARLLLGPSRVADAVARAEAGRVAESARADRLAVTRTRAVGAADDERRRIERDLHDGAQQRLVALGVELGAARRRAATDPQEAVAALDHAHAEVKATLAELRDLVRGIHPAVLADRGLDAALSALAARSPVPTTVAVTAPEALAACSPAAQAAAYFVVAEALTNVARHAGAGAARVEAGCADRSLRVVVHDDGRGGADPAAGSGLAGLRARVEALDGTFTLVSPSGEGTTLTVEVPCAS